MIRPVDAPRGQGFGENPTSTLPAGHWILKQFGNYQPDGHAGEDYPCDVGTPIRAVTSGRVLHVGYYGGTYADNPYWIAPNFAGYCYVIDHGAFIGIYAHGKDEGSRVSVGQRVNEGQVIGLTGNTGGSTGPHLHFEILPDQFVVNSYMYGRVNPEQFFGSAAIAPQGTITTSEEDDMAVTPSFEPQVREALAIIVDAVDGFPIFDQNVRAVFDVIRSQNEAQTATISQLVTMLAERESLDAEAIISGVTDAIAERVKITATIDGAAK